MAKIDLFNLQNQYEVGNDQFLLVDQLDASLNASVDEPHAPIKSDDYFLFLLGTDTSFVKEPTRNLPKETKGRRDYKRGETLSFTAQTIVHMKGEVVNPNVVGSPLAYSSESVAVVNGPTTYGTEVGNRIAWAIYLALEAVVKGKKTLQLSAHSRGACEAILAIHELVRIKPSLRDSLDKSLLDILLESPCAYTRAAVKELFKDTTDVGNPRATAFRQKLAQGLDDLKINAFLIDPVPGEAVLGFGAWVDPRFSQLLPCQRAEELLYRDERSGYFIPIVPKGIQPIIIPGHHGSGSGNQYDQQSKKPSKPVSEKLSTKGRTTTVQDLVLHKLLHFWEESLQQPLGVAPSDNLGHEALSGVLGTYLNAVDKQALLLKSYDAVHKNDKFYRKFTEGNYAWVGQSTSLDKKHRLMHLREQQNTSMEVLESVSQGFVNTEHAAFYLQQLIGDILPAIKLDHSPAEMAIQVSNLLSVIVAEILNSTGSPLCEALKTADGRAILFEALSMRTEFISQKYLRNHLKDDEKASLMHAINASFTVLTNAFQALGAEAENEMILRTKSIITECQQKLQDNLKRTIETHFQWLIDESNQMDQHIDLFLHPERFSDVWSAFLESLREVPELSDMLRSLNVLDEINVAKVECRLLDHLDVINSLERGVKEKFKAKLSPLQRYFDIQQNKIEHYLKNIEQFYVAVTSLIQVGPKLTEHIGDKGLAVTGADLRCLRMDLLTKAGFLLKESDYNLSETPPGITDVFFEQAKIQAIAQGAVSPLVTALKKQHLDEIEALSLRLADLSDQTRSMNEQHVAETNALSVTVQKQNVQKETLQVRHTAETAALSSKLEELNGQHEALKAQQVVEASAHSLELNELKLQHEALNAQHVGEANVLSLKLAEQIARNDDISAQHLVIANALSTELDELKSQHEALKVQHLDRAKALCVKLREQTAQQDELIAQHGVETAALSVQLAEQIARNDALIGLQVDAVDDLRLQHETLKGQFAALSLNFDEQVVKNGALLAQHEAMLSPKESKINLAIFNKLIPLTDQYLTHLLKKAKKYNSKIDVKNLSQTLASCPANVAYEDLKLKYEKVQLLRKELTNPKGLPSEHIQSFSKTLKGFDKDLGRHRDKAWNSFATACLIIANILTGFIPGAIYAMATHKSPFFFSSHGTRFKENCEEKIIGANKP